MTTVNDTARDLILSICISFDQARFFSRFVVKLFTQKPLSFKRCITEKIEIRKSFQISDLDSIGYLRVLKEMSLLVRYFYTQLLILHCLAIVEVKS